ncbi:DUF4097 family beta strand repeat-containing protein [Salegentibacter chungangensis]|uniref:DUF4097 family beta strand repeat-containing protein n=1 Tax=Salegentibacter chungangensis TaxID=1335724 RepID=A0ABW3NNN8_9FLAO
MRSIILNILLGLCLPLVTVAQRDAVKTFDAEGIQTIEINTDEVYLVHLKTTAANSIKVSAHSEGEYFNRIALNYKLKKDKLIIASEYPEILSGGYDKLSAHKVFSLEVWIELPEDMDVRLSSNLAALVAEGNFRNLSANLNEGYCKLTGFTGNASINTFRGNILVETNNAQVEAESGSGRLRIPDNLRGTYIIRLKSVSGDISVFKN